MNFRGCLRWGGLGSSWREGTFERMPEAVFPSTSDFPFLETFLQPSVNLGAPGFRSRRGSLVSPVVLSSFVPVFLTGKTELVIALTTYGLVRMNNEMMSAKRFAKPVQVFSLVISQQKPAG